MDFIFHLAGVNRPKDINEFYEGNSNLTKIIVNMLKKKKNEHQYYYLLLRLSLTMTMVKAS